MIADAARRAWKAESFMATAPTEPTSENLEGRARVADGVLEPSEATRPITPAEYASQNFIIDPDFLSPADCDGLLSAFDRLHGRVKHRKIGIDFWEGRIVYMGDVLAYSPALAEVMAGFQKRATERLGAFYRLTRPLWTDTVQLNLWEEGSFLPCHVDNANPDGSSHSTPWRDFSSIVYLNDDYEGGELYFTAQDRVLRPRKGMLVAFSAGWIHEHGVLKVRRGRRVTMPAFYTFDRAHTDKIVYPELSAVSAAPVRPSPAGTPGPTPLPGLGATERAPTGLDAIRGGRTRWLPPGR